MSMKSQTKAIYNDQSQLRKTTLLNIDNKSSNKGAFQAPMAHDFLCLCNMKIAACSSAGGDATALHVTP